ncbi:2,3-bisphosphoglycerate-independent phosphoglycerate mutase, partial [bacterium]|nr:2,3-bisphosphoglycerate-independent phosphoglycerate mutase [candidate division CSSED10-310 bacterium]
VWGRYYGMDRSKNWELIRVARDALLDGKGRRTTDFLQTIRDAYRQEKTPDHVPMVDEYLTPIIHRDYPGMKSNDVVINFNYRQDRAIQISQAFTDPSCPAFDQRCAGIHYTGLTRYYNEFKHYLMPPMDGGDSLVHILGDVISRSGKTQLRIAETQKFRHVTSFFNGKSTRPFLGEDQVEVPGTWDPATYASHPEMNAEDVTRELMARWDTGYDFIVVNYANCDMVGHTGDFDAAKRGAAYVDGQVQRVAEEALTRGYAVIVTADHGNSEEMLDSRGAPKTSHSINPVKMFLLLPEGRARFSVSHGILSDIAPLILLLMGLPIPGEMTSRRLADAVILP